MSDENTPTSERLFADRALRARLTPEGHMIVLLESIDESLKKLLTFGTRLEDAELWQGRHERIHEDAHMGLETPVEVKPVAAKRKKVRTPHGGGAGA